MVLDWLITGQGQVRCIFEMYFSSKDVVLHSDQQVLNENDQTERWTQFNEVGFWKNHHPRQERHQVQNKQQNEQEGPTCFELMNIRNILTRRIKP